MKAILEDNKQKQKEFRKAVKKMKLFRRMEKLDNRVGGQVTRYVYAGGPAPIAEINVTHYQNEKETIMATATAKKVTKLFEVLSYKVIVVEGLFDFKGYMHHEMGTPSLNQWGEYTGKLGNDNPLMDVERSLIDQGYVYHPEEGAWVQVIDVKWGLHIHARYAWLTTKYTATTYEMEVAE